MLLTRVFDDRMQRTQRQGKISFYMRSLGEEAVSVAQCMALRPADMLFPSYRNQGFYMVRGRPLVDLMCQLLSNTRDMCKGRQLPVMYHWAAGPHLLDLRQPDDAVPAGRGLGDGCGDEGHDDIAASWIGEGSSAEADFHHAMLFASVYQAPVILNVVNNQWAISTFQGFAGGEQRSFAARGPGLRHGRHPRRRQRFPRRVCGHAVGRASARARGAGPTLIEHVTYRGAAHSTSDDPSRYRPKNDYEKWPLGDPVERLKNHLIALGEWSEERHAALTRGARRQAVTDGWKEATKYGTLNEGPRLDRDLMFEDVFKEMPEHLRRQREQLHAEQG